MTETRDSLRARNIHADAAKLHEYLHGPCENLRLLKIEARLEDVHLAETTSEWASALMKLAYPNSKPYRKLRILINPIGGPGKATQLFKSRILPILEAAGCILDTTVTTHAYHGIQLARELPLEQKFDAIACVSGDGMIHEVLNGLAQRSDAMNALQIPVVPIPAGSGNAIAINLLGVKHGFNLALACLNAVKGNPMPVDVCSVTQPAPQPSRTTSHSSQLRKTKRKSKSSQDSADDPSTRSSQSSSHVALPTTDHPGYETSYSILSQAIGLMADLDLGTENLRALGDTRFVLGYIAGVFENRVCEVDIYVKFGKQGSINKADMRKSVLASQTHAARSSESNGKVVGESEEHLNTSHNDHDLNASSTFLPKPRNGVATDTLQNEDGASQLKNLVPQDPSFSSSLLPPSDSTHNNIDPDQWYHLDVSICALYAGKIPYVGRDLLQFPFALANDACIDMALQLQQGGRAAKLRAISGAETGIVIYDPAVAYLKCEAYRVVPRLAEGHKNLKKGGLISIDGEHKPYRAFQVEVDDRIRMQFLSLFGQWQVPDVPPPGAA